MTCTVEGCDRTAKGRGLCPTHWSRWRKHGDPTVRKRGWRDTPETRFWLSVEKTDTCWLWRGSAASGGYGKMRIDGKMVRAHQLAYELLVGPIPDGLFIDHLCRNPSCVNPGHLEPVTNQENTRRGLGGLMVTHCPHGHEYTPENTYVNRGHRFCRACETLRGLRRKEERAAQRSTA